MDLLAPSLQFLFLFAFLIPLVFFLLTQQNTLRAVQPQHRALAPGAVWLQLIPLFGMVWQFVVVARIADSLARELQARQLRFSFEQQPDAALSQPAVARPTYSIGLAYCILMCLFFVPFLNVLTTLAGFVCWIIYWVQLAGYRRQLRPVPVA